MKLIPIAALCAAAFGLSACDSAQQDSTEPTSADALFDASVFGTTNNIIAVRNAPDAENRDRAFRADPALNGKARLFDEGQLDAAIPGGVRSFQQAAFSLADRDFYGTFDGNDGNGRLVRVNRNGSIAAVTNAGTMPKGIFVDIDVSTGFVGVADFGMSAATSSILIYNEDFADNEAPVIVISNLGTGGRAWDLFYSEEDDILFVSKTNGEVAAYDNFRSLAVDFISEATPIAPTREFAVSNPSTPGTRESTNLHGISYDEDTKILIVSDVRIPTNTQSGRLYTVDNGDTAGAAPNTAGMPSNLVPFRARFQSSQAGNATRLGNPVDILGYGDDVYVAAKGSNQVLRFDDILTRTGDQGDTAPNATLTVEGAESVAFFQR